MSTYRLKDFVDPIAITVQDPANSGFERFVGLEHYDSNELVIKRFSGVELLTTNAKAFQKNDLLIARRNVYLRRAGVVYFDGITSGDSIVLRVKEDCEKQTGISRELAQRVLPLVLNTDRFWIYANKHADGMNSKRISKDTLLDYEFDLPSIEEQKVLADKLWAAYKVKESYRQLLFTTDEMLKAKFQEMFGDVDNNKHNFPVEALGKICECYAGATPSTEKSEYWNGGTIPWMSSGEVHKKFVTYTDAFITTEGYNHSSTKMVPIHSIVVALAGQGKTRGTVAVNEIELCTNQSLCAIVPSSTINYLYLFHNLNSRYLEIRNMAGDIAGRGGLNLKIINSIKVILPPMELQQQFAEIATQAEATKASLRASIEAIDRVIRSLINQ